MNAVDRLWRIRTKQGRYTCALLTFLAPCALNTAIHMYGPEHCRFQHEGQSRCERCRAWGRDRVKLWAMKAAPWEWRDKIRHIDVGPTLTWDKRPQVVRLWVVGDCAKVPINLEPEEPWKLETRAPKNGASRGAQFGWERMVRKLIAIREAA